MLSFPSVLRDLSFKTRLGRRPHTINTDSLASLHSTQLTRLTLTFFFPRSTKCNRDAASSLIVGGACIQARTNHGANGIALTKKTGPGSLNYHCGCSPRRLENSAAQTPDITHVCARKLRQTAGARTSRNVPLGIRADPVGTPLRERLHPQDAPSRQHWRNTVAHVKQRRDTPETARPMMR